MIGIFDWEETCPKCGKKFKFNEGIDLHYWVVCSEECSDYGD